ncbi:DUF4936 family protein [Paucibacter sp. APW11]|uniref:DUF4936 family protein n=1 Tax=Roseateles aquae TaxID=3077235 RepID=A0ABU3P6I9_9BURK|nr:DUF4936 family protein [Paucibacter sp. APW11]MDT8997688.1 DUF4936 family protein [Paucibacter sp. APW11]
MKALGTELYVYYQLSPADEAAAGAALAALPLAAGVQRRLLRRAEAAEAAEPADQATWMEIYSGAAPTLLEAAERQAALALRPWLAEGARHIERFTPLDVTAP